MNRPVKHFYEFGSFRLDTVEHRLLRDGRPVALKPKVFNLLLELVTNSGHILLKDELMRRVWPDTFVEEHNLAVGISTLRKALGGDQNDYQYIETIPRRGYRFVAGVREVWDDPVALSEGSAKRAATPSPVSSESHSIAVLPFKSIGTRGSEDVFLGLGMADALITRLGNLNQIIVRPTSVVRKFAEGSQDPVSAGNELGVTAVLDGSIQRSGKSIRVTVQLVSIANGTTLWADKFDEKFTDIFAVEDSISEQVTTALTLTLTDKERERLRKRYTENSEAYQAYLKGRFFLSKRNAKDMLRSSEYFEEAISKDPDYALAFAGLAEYYLQAANYNLLSAKEAIPKSRNAVLKALELDEALAEAHSALAYLKFTEWDWAASEQEFKRAISLNPNIVETRKNYAIYLRCLGRFDEALAQMKKAHEIDPLSASVITTVGSTLHFARRYDQALEQLWKAVELDSTFVMAHHYLGLAYEQKGLWDNAIRAFEKILDLRPTPDFKALLAHAYASSGRTAAARALLQELHELAKDSYISPYDLALVHAALAEDETAIVCLERAYHERCADMGMLRVDQRLDHLRNHPRFVQLIKLMDFPPLVA